MSNAAGDVTSGWLPRPHADIYWEASGNPAGVPVLFLHGGPGGSLRRGSHRGRHDPQRFWTIALDQRGCGRSTPAAQDDLEHLADNNTAALIADLEALREHLSVPAWLVTGISWGSTLALAYALAHPQRLHGLALMAVTTTSRSEVDWITSGMGRIYPEAWEEFMAAAQARPGERAVEAYARRLAGADREDAHRAAQAWDRWESWHPSLNSPKERGSYIANARDRETFALLVAHYWSNDGFLPEGQAILARAQGLAGIPGHLIHGRRDVSGPAMTPWLLHQQWPGSTLTIVEDEGHAGPAMTAALVDAVAELAGKIPQAAGIRPPHHIPPG